MNSFWLKILGILCMALDHIGVYIYKLPIGIHPLRVIGRIAAPLFLYVTVNSLYYTKHKKIYLARLYCFHVIIGLFTEIIFKFGNKYYGQHEQFSIFPMFIYTILIILCIENFRNSEKEYWVKRIIKLFLRLAVIILVPFVVVSLFPGYKNLLNIVIPNILIVPYSPFFIIMGVLWYFFRNKRTQILLLCVFSFLSLAGTYIFSYMNSWVFTNYFNTNQFWMILFAPILLLYDGKKGKNSKWSFYLYYPIHIFFLMFVGNIVN